MPAIAVHRSTLRPHHAQDRSLNPYRVHRRYSQWRPCDALTRVDASIEELHNDTQSWESENDPRFRIPLSQERKEFCGRNGAPFQLGPNEFASSKALSKTGAMLKLTKNKFDKNRAWKEVEQATWRGDARQCSHVTIRSFARDDLIPTHLLSLVSSEATDSPVAVAVHLDLLRGSWAHLDALPPSRRTTRKAPDLTAARELPVVELAVPNASTFGTILHYTYLQDDRALLGFLLGPVSDNFGDNWSMDLDLDRRCTEWEASRELASTYSSAELFMQASFINGLAANATSVGMLERAFWRILDTSLRVIIDACIFQHRMALEETPVETIPVKTTPSETTHSERTPSERTPSETSPSVELDEEPASLVRGASRDGAESDNESPPDSDSDSSGMASEDEDESDEEW
ncbi:hypothetical protein PIIN_09808 [Serendipita indica DSM 11827]|uniref:Uncharacterized protein n=1 Tax=Serendipita indica (strain DSM 11827) TaxID=1109443 RepID=G4TWX7_SERID|nr:hypothetical protein PIIN_09808 [Serendipita indica DSM 11827]